MSLLDSTSSQRLNSDTLPPLKRTEPLPRARMKGIHAFRNVVQGLADQRQQLLDEIQKNRDLPLTA